MRALLPFLVALTLFLLGGCKTFPLDLGVGEKADLPTWYTQLPADDNAYYAVGEGLSFKASEKAARASLAEQVQVQVSSYVKTLQVRDGAYQRDAFRAETETEASKIALTTAIVVQQELRGANCYSMIKLEKSALVTQQSAQLQQDKSDLVHVLNQAGVPSFERWWQLRKAQAVAERVQSNVILLAVVAGQDDGIARQLVQNYQYEVRQTEGVRKVRLVNRTDIDGVEDLLREQLSDQGIDVAQDANATTLEVATRFKHQTIGTDIYLDGEMSLQLISSRGAVLNLRKTNKAAVVMGDQSQGIRQINKKLYQAIKSENVLEQLLNES